MIGTMLTTTAAATTKTRERRIIIMKAYASEFTYQLVLEIFHCRLYEESVEKNTWKIQKEIMVRKNKFIKICKRILQMYHILEERST